MKQPDALDCVTGRSASLTAPISVNNETVFSSFGRLFLQESTLVSSDKSENGGRYHFAVRAKTEDQSCCYLGRKESHRCAEVPLGYARQSTGAQVSDGNYKPTTPHWCKAVEETYGRQEYFPLYWFKPWGLRKPWLDAGPVPATTSTVDRRRLAQRYCDTTFTFSKYSITRGRNHEIPLLSHQTPSLLHMSELNQTT